MGNRAKNGPLGQIPSRSEECVVRDCLRGDTRGSLSGKPLAPRIRPMPEVTQPLRFALAQLNTTVGDIDGNSAAVVEALGRARSEGAQVVVFPELAVTGYPPEDLLLKTHFLSASRRAVDEIAREVGEMVVLVGFAEHAED